METIYLFKKFFEVNSNTMHNMRGTSKRKRFKKV